MTASNTDSMAAPVTDTVTVAGVPLSALVNEVPRPRAVVLSLHGGGTTSAYFDCPGRPGLSLLRTAAALGFTAVALDRPGYGASGQRAAELSDERLHVDLAFGALDALLGDRPRGAGVFLVAHSAGCRLAVRMAAGARNKDLLGLEIAGTGRHHPGRPGQILGTDGGDLGGPESRRRGLRDLLWGPRRLYAADVYADRTVVAPSPGYEKEAYRRWVDEFPSYAAGVRVPVQCSLGDHETVWASGPAALHDIAALFTASPRVRVNEQSDSGHNLSLGLTARAYHLKVLSFAEECAALRETAVR